MLIAGFYWRFEAIRRGIIRGFDSDMEKNVMIIGGWRLTGYQEKLNLIYHKSHLVDKTGFGVKR
jgi:hypothetical protein